jgi:hypothetical protein
MCRRPTKKGRLASNVIGAAKSSNLTLCCCRSRSPAEKIEGLRAPIDGYCAVRIA